MRCARDIDDVKRTANWEPEIKLRISAGARAAARLLDLHGYVEKLPRTLQADQLFDLPDLALRKSSRLLRLRSEGSSSVLTYKGPPRPGPHKSRVRWDSKPDNRIRRTSSHPAPTRFEELLADAHFARSWRATSADQ
jgi:inorganic triphosphatase YgiF